MLASLLELFAPLPAPLEVLFAPLPTLLAELVPPVLVHVLHLLPRGHRLQVAALAQELDRVCGATCGWDEELLVAGLSPLGTVAARDLSWFLSLLNQIAVIRAVHLSQFYRAVVNAITKGLDLSSINADGEQFPPKIMGTTQPRRYRQVRYNHHCMAVHKDRLYFISCAVYSAPSSVNA